MEPLHQPTDTSKVVALTESMERDGWLGSPLVAIDDQLLTGSHRYAAAQEAGIDIPTIDLRDLFADAGLDFDAMHADEGFPTIDEWGSWEYLLGQLPQSTRDEYGLDV